jgi:hypothetical protein
LWQELFHGWLALVRFSRSHRKVKTNNYHGNFQYCTEFVFYWAFKITLHGLHATNTTKVMGLTGSRSKLGGANPGMLGQLALVSNDLFTTTGYTALGNNNAITVF